MRTNNIPGCVYGIVYDGELVLSSSMGVREPYTDKAVAKDTRFRIASMSKSFTSMAVLHLRDCGLLSLDDPVQRHVPQLNLISNSAPTSSQYGDKSRVDPMLTIRHLLSMQGGLPQDDPWGDRLLAQSSEEFRMFLSGGKL